MKKQNNFLKRLKIRLLIKKMFIKYFSYRPAALVNNLLRQNTQDLRKGLADIKQPEIKLNEHERNSTNNKN